MASQSRDRLPELDGLRALACLMVFFAHTTDYAPVMAPAAAGGRFGVMLFFVLSGFLMGTLYLGRAWTLESVSRYAVARFVRIAPIYLVVVIAAYLIYMIWPGFVYPIDNSNVIRHLMFSGNKAMFWSIPPEVQFYGVFILLWGAIAAYQARGWIMPIILFSLLVLASLAYSGRFPGTFVGAHIQFFLSGIGAAWLRPRIAPVLNGTLALSFLQIAALLLFAVTTAGATSPFNDSATMRYHPDARALIPALVVLALSIPSPVSTPIFANPAARAIGAWSFSLYLVHLAVLHVVSPLVNAGGVVLFVTVGAMASLALSALAYRFVERPSQNLLRPLLTNALLRGVGRSTGATSHQKQLVS